MWTSRNRCRYERKGLRYPTDLTDAEWALVAPHIRAAKRGGRPRTTNMREVTNAILYVLGTGCQWRALPKDFPPRTTVFEYLDLWEWDGTLGRLHHALFLATREQADKEASPTAAGMVAKILTCGAALPRAECAADTPREVLQGLEANTRIECPVSSQALIA